MQLRHSNAWKNLIEHQRNIADIHLSELFQRDDNRFQEFSYQLGDLFIDLSKNLITSKTIDLLLQLAEQQHVKDKINQLMKGDKINITENQPVLHLALRNHGGSSLANAINPIVSEIKHEYERMYRFVAEARANRIVGTTGKPLTHIVNIGVGGSSLGTELVAQALIAYQDHFNLHFISTIDGEQIADLLHSLNPETTLFIVASKSFRSADTLSNAYTARDWLTTMLKQDAAVAKHFVGVSMNQKAMDEFGICPDYCFKVWNGVGGRYSIWSTVGLSIALAMGMDNFEQFLAGAALVDNHFTSQPLAKNIPVLLALIDIWYQNFFNYPTRAIFPYSSLLKKLPAYLQQLEMESLGKQTTIKNTCTDYQTGCIVWGDVGFLGQHAFFQLLHQGTQIVPADFISPLYPSHELAHHKHLAIANLLAQTRALMLGRKRKGVKKQLEANGYKGEALAMILPHQDYPGNRPTTTILFPRLSPRSLGSLLALYEHRVYVKSAIWDINAFDQWGVELGKEMAADILQLLKEQNELAEQDLDASTKGLLQFIRTQ